MAQDHGGGSVSITQTDDAVIIGNDFLARSFSIKDGIWSTSEIVNKRTDKDLTLVPQEGSEDFVIQLLSAQEPQGPVITLPTHVLDRAAWKAAVTTKRGDTYTQSANLFDGDKNTYVDEYEKHGYPTSIVIDLGSVQSVGSFSYDKRPGYGDAAYGKNGTMGKYKLYVSEDGRDWSAAGSGEFTAEDYNLHDEGGLHNVGDTVYGNFDKVYGTRYVKIEQLSDALGSTQEFTASEVNLFSDQKVVEGAAEADADIRTSELTVAENGVTVDQDANTVRVQFSPVEFEGNTFSIAEVIAMEDGAHYMNSHLEITASDADATKIDYIDMDSFVLPEDAADVWSIPDESKVSSMWIGKHELMLGQPIYVDGLFLGSEFPAQETDVIEDTNTTKMRYYSGKDIAKMAADGQEAKVAEDGSGTFRTWSNVVGAAEDTAEKAVQTDFFSYINDLATPSEFRKQYNSWYDNMMNISPESVAKSFLGAEKGLSQNGVEPLDSYVVDDGWNNYNSESQGMTGVGESGDTYNQTGFWEFNSKWPNELYDSASLAHNLQSSFGIWVGPQGGYNFFGQFGRFLEDSGTGYTQHNSALGDVVCTGSHKYLENFTNLFLDYQGRFDIDYWKWDGFASRPCNATDHDHMVGGPNNMYFTSDMWEQWTNLFEDFREARAAQDKGLWINATCYINPSPWMLQWVNTIWLQDSGDTGQSGNTDAERHQQKIYYRDHVYYNMFENNDLQFPLKNVYNHDPIYGVSDNSSATTEAFREFLFDNAMRGTSFWELYYSPSLMDDAKWDVTADALDFAERNHGILANAKLFYADGAFRSTNLGDKLNEVYGYSAWNSEGGIVSFVNPSSESRTYALKLDNIAGVPTGMKGLAETRVYPYAAAPSGKTVSYGDTLKVTLEPHSSQIFQYGAGDTRTPEVTTAKIDGSKLHVSFNTRVSDQADISVDGKAVNATLMDDYRTFEVDLGEKADSVKVSVDNAVSTFGVAAKGAIDFEADASGAVAKLSSAEEAGDVEVREHASDLFESPMLDLNSQQVTLSDKGIAGSSDFSVKTAVSTTSTGAVVAAQGDDWSLAIDGEGYVTFTVAGNTVSSKHEVTTVTGKAHGAFGTDAYVPTVTETAVAGKVNDGAVHTVIASREFNGMVQLYIDGELVNSMYDEQAADAGQANAKLAGAPVVVGSADYVGHIGDFEVINHALYYDDAAQQAEDFSLGLTHRAASQEGWEANACSEANAGTDGPASDAIDGDASTYWHSNYSGADHCDGTHGLTVNFGKDVSFDNIVYTARHGKSNGTWESVKIFGVKADGSEVKLADISEILYEGNDATFAFDEAQTFSGLRFEIVGKGGFASAAEINVTTNLEAVDLSAVNALHAHARDLFSKVSEADYTAASYKVFFDAVDAALDLNPFDDASAAKVAELTENLDAAYNGLVKKQNPAEVDKSALQALVDKAGTLVKDDYTADSWASLEETLGQAKAVLADPAATQDDVDHMVSGLQGAMDALVKASDPVNPSKPSGTGDGSDAGKGQNGSKTDGKLVKTGDDSMVAIAAVAAVGVIAVAGGAVAHERRGRKS